MKLPSNTPMLHVRQDVGRGKPLVLLHGMFADGSQWETITNLLKKDFRVIVVDLLGHGQSPRPPLASYNDKEHVAALRLTLESLDAVKEATVVGYSMGGAVALAYSAEYPEAVEQLYLISTPFYLSPEQMSPNRYAGSVLFAKASIGLFGLVEKHMHEGGRVEKIIDFANDSKIFHSMIGANDNVLETQIIRKNLKHLVHQFDFVGHLKKLKAPLTLYAGKKDLFIAQTQLNALRQYHPYMDIQRLDIIKVDHMLVQNLPNEIAGLLHKNAQNLLHVGIDKGRGNNMLMIHGIESSSSFWAPLAIPLAENRRVIALDLLGFGDSPKPLNIAYSLNDQAEWLKRTLDAYGVDTMDVVAHSLGCLVALKFASLFPERIRSLTLFAPVFVPHKSISSNQIIKRLNFADKLGDGSFLQSHVAQALGYKRMSKYIPVLRTVQNAIRRQNVRDLADKAAAIPTRIVFGERDGLIDAAYLRKISAKFRSADVISLKRSGHNFALFEPEMALQYGFPAETFQHEPLKSSKLPPTFAKQLVVMAVPILFGKSILYFVAGFLLFTVYAPWVVVLGLAFIVIKFGFDYIQGAFSLKNENLSYIGYVILGAIAVCLGYSLIKHSDTALRISSLVIAGLVFLAGVARIIVAWAWTKQAHLRHGLLMSGTILSAVGALALAGGIYSANIIIYSLGALLVIRGIQFAIFSTGAVITAYVRGFNR